MLRYGIPAYRLPPDLLDQELDQIRVLGIPIHTGAASAASRRSARTTTPCSSASAPSGRGCIPIDGVHQPFVLGGIDFLRCRSQRRTGPGRAAGRRRRRRQRRHRRRPDRVAAGRAARRPGLPREAPRDAGEPARDRERRRRRCAAAPGLGSGTHRRGRRGHLPVLRTDPRRRPANSIRSSTPAAC